MRRWMMAMLLAMTATSMAQAADSTLFDRMGGKPGLSAIASRLVDYTTNDPRIAQHFADTNVPRLKGLLTLFFCKQLGGPCSYPGRDMVAAHAEMGLRDVDFNVLVECLQQAMTDQGISNAMQNEFLAQLAPMHRDVVKD